MKYITGTITGSFAEIRTMEAIPHPINMKDREPFESKRHAEYIARGNLSAFKALRSLFLGNFRSYDKFLTLTFRDNDSFDIRSVDSCNLRKKHFLTKLRADYPDLKYVIVPEYQKRGAVHYHMVCDLPFIDKEKFHSYWPYGFCSIEAITSTKKTLLYVTKYLSKSPLPSSLKGKRRYYTSNNLNRPVTLSKRMAISLIREYVTGRLSLFEQLDYSTPYGQRVTYRSFVVPPGILRAYQPAAPPGVYAL